MPGKKHPHQLLGHRLQPHAAAASALSMLQPHAPVSVGAPVGPCLLPHPHPHPLPLPSSVTHKHTHPTPHHTTPHTHTCQCLRSGKTVLPFALSPCSPSEGRWEEWQEGRLVRGGSSRGDPTPVPSPCPTATWSAWHPTPPHPPTCSTLSKALNCIVLFFCSEQTGVGWGGAERVSAVPPHSHTRTPHARGST